MREVIRVSAHFLTSDFPYSGTTMVMIEMQKSDPTDPRYVSSEWAASCQLSQESHTAENYASVLKVAVTIS